MEVGPDRLDFEGQTAVRAAVSWAGATSRRQRKSKLRLAPDGKRFALFLELKAPAETKGSNQVTCLLNFFDELRRRVMVGAR